MKKFARFVIAGLSALIPASALASHVSPASLGKFIDRGDEFCFQESWGAMINDGAGCTGTPRRLAVPVHTFWDGVQTAGVSVKAQDTSHPVCCEMVTALNGGRKDVGPARCSLTDSSEVLTLTANFANRNPGWVVCSVPFGARVNHVWFSGS